MVASFRGTGVGDPTSPDGAVVVVDGVFVFEVGIRRRYPDRQTGRQIAGEQAPSDKGEENPDSIVGTLV